MHHTTPFFSFESSQKSTPSPEKTFVSAFVRVDNNFTEFFWVEYGGFSFLFLSWLIERIRSRPGGLGHPCIMLLHTDKKGETHGKHQGSAENNSIHS